MNKTAHFSSIQWFTLSLLVCGYIFFAVFIFQTSRESALENLNSEGEILVNAQAYELKSELQKLLLVPSILSENPDVTSALLTRSNNSIKQLNEKLHSLTSQIGATYIFVIDDTGTTIASSNHAASDSFIGRDYKFRPYFQRAMENGSAEYYAKGETTGRPGLFLAGRVAIDGKPLGAIIVKVEFDGISERFRHSTATTVVIDQNDIILFSSDKSLNFKTISPLSIDKEAEILAARQFGTEPLKPSGIDLNRHPFVHDPQKRNSLVNFAEISELDWRLARIYPVKADLSGANMKAQLISLLVGGLLACLFWLWRRRSLKEIEKTRITNLLKTEVRRRTKQLSETNARLEHEISEKEKINVRFRSAREELAQANRLGSIGAITASVAHELNQPVSAIRTYAENGHKLLQRGDIERTSQNLGSIVALTDRIGSISTELRRYARRGSHAVTSVEMIDVFDGVMLLMGERLKDAGINIQVTNKLDDIPPLKAGRVRLEQVFVILLTNALDALEGHENPKIRIGVSFDDTDLNITVADNGKGIADDIATHIFTPFMTTKKDGMGMGLGIARDIITEFGGTIELAQSSLGGATFFIRLKRYG